MAQAANQSNEPILKGEYDGAALILDLDGYGGPLHVLLSLAREQKVDLTRISILKLAEQYIEFISRAKRENIELAGDYLVMAAWLAYLKSRLLLPKREKNDDEIAPEILSSHLAWRLKRLDAMRVCGKKLQELPQTGLDVHVRGQIDELRPEVLSIYDADFIDLLRAYCNQRNKVKAKIHKVEKWPVYSLEEARQSLRTKLPKDNDWHELGQFAPKKSELKNESPSPKSQYASLLSASLEMVKQGEINLRQLAIYDKVFLQKRDLGTK
jgi:segregation and condensation protein A